MRTEAAGKEESVNRLIRASSVLVALCAAASGVVEAAEGRESAPSWRDYAQGSKWTEGEKRLREEIVRICSQKKLPAISKLRPAHYSYNVCRNFQQVENNTIPQSARGKYVSWLLAHPQLTEDLLLAFARGDNRGRAFEVVYRLRRKSEKQTLKYRELTIAFAIVWDAYAADGKELTDSFQYFTSNAKRMRFDPATQPWEVSKYVVDLRRPVSERVWALNRYGRSSNVGRLYSMIRYDDRAFERGESRASRMDVPLQDMRKSAGVCHDRAVFASAVGKAIGVPTVYIHGAAGSGALHAWIGFLRKRSGGYAWDADTGRIGSERSSSGFIREPQESRQVSEHELGLALAALRYSSALRRKARIWRDAAAALAAAGKKEAAARAMRESLAECVCDKSQWRSWAALARAGVYSGADVAAAVGEFNKKLQSWPELAVDAFEALVETLGPDAALLRVRQYSRMAKTFSRNYGAVARVRLLEGRWLESTGDTRGALKVYSSGFLDALKHSVGGMGLLDNAGRLLVKSGKLRQAIDLHEKAFGRIRTPSRSAFVFAMQTSKFKVGLRLATLLQKAGKKKAAGQMIRKIAGYGRGRSEERALMTRQLANLAYDAVNTTKAPGDRERTEDGAAED